MMRRPILLRLALASLTLLASVTVDAQTLTERQYRNLERLQGLLNESRPDEVLAATATVTAEQGSLAAALLLQLRAQAQQMQGNDAKAVADLRAALATEALPTDRALIAAITLAQLETGLGNYASARNILLPFAEGSDPLPPLAQVIIAVSYLQESAWKEALPWIVAATSDDTVADGWLSMRLTAEYQSGRYAEAAETLKRLIVRNPSNPVHWMQLAGVYQQLGQSGLQLATLELAHASGVPLDEQAQRVLAAMQIQQGVPERAARTLSDSTDESDVRLRITALRSAREFSAAAAELERLSESDGGRNLLADAARLYWMDGDCINAQRVASRHLETTDNGSLMILAGTCAQELEQYDQARIHFQRALGVPEVAVTARRWLDYLAAQGRI